MASAFISGYCIITKYFRKTSCGGASGNKKKLKAKVGLEAKVKNAIEILDKTPFQEQFNLTDPDAPVMKGKKGDFDTNYNIQVACGEDQLITFCDVVVQGNDKSQLVPSLKGINNNTRKEIKTVLADADYGTFDSLAYMAQSNMVGYVPYRDMNTTFKDQPFHAVHFVYDKKNDFYTNVDWSQARRVDATVEGYQIDPERLTFQQGQPYRLRLENNSNYTCYFASENFFKNIAVQKLVTPTGVKTIPYYEEISITLKLL